MDPAGAHPGPRLLLDPRGAGAAGLSCARGEHSGGGVHFFLQRHLKARAVCVIEQMRGMCRESAPHRAWAAQQQATAVGPGWCVSSRHEKKQVEKQLCWRSTGSGCSGLASCSFQRADSLVPHS